MFTHYTCFLHVLVNVFVVVVVVDLLMFVVCFLGYVGPPQHQREVRRVPAFYAGRSVSAARDGHATRHRKGQSDPNAPPRNLL